MYRIALDKHSMKLIITMPIYEDWDSAIELCRRIDALANKADLAQISVLLVDDGSQASVYPLKLPFCPETIERVAVLELRRNLGHQRAIAVSLAWIHAHDQGDAVVVMDGDGEDRPEDIPQLIHTFCSQESTAVIAVRGKRLDTAIFRIFYQIYRVLHRLLTGRDIHFGNFSILSWSDVDTLIVFPELWNHYAATLLKCRLKYSTVKIDRGRRIAGRSHMGFGGLLVHGLSALFANYELVVTRLLILTVASGIVLSVAVAAVVAVRLMTDLAIPGWATTALGILMILVGQAVIAAFLLVVSIMMNRSNLGFLPARDYAHFVRRVTTLYSR